MSAADEQRWRVTVRAGNEPDTAAMQVLDPRGQTTIVLWGTPEDDGDDVVLDVNIHTNVTADGDRARLGGALALYLEAVAACLRGPDGDAEGLANRLMQAGAARDEAELAEAAVRSGMADVVIAVQGSGAAQTFSTDA